ncbi:MAG: hypothetical protein AAF743_09015 [Planctomycetota bacterium]
MPEIMDAHPLTIAVIAAAMMTVPFHLVCTYAFGSGFTRRGAVIAGCSIAWGGMMTAVCIADVPRSIGPAGQLIIPTCWLTPSAILLLGRRWFRPELLDQRWLVGLQLWRVIGAVFLLEMTRGNLPGIFAWPAGVGDIIAALVALVVLLRFRGQRQFPRWAVVLVAVVGLVDFAGAFFFGFFSNETPVQLFFPEVPNDVLSYPTGLVPLFLVPWAIFFHVLSLLALREPDPTAHTPEAEG